MFIVYGIQVFVPLPFLLRICHIHGSDHQTNFDKDTKE